jgi:DNA polymerase-3 subunit alpha
MDVEVFEGMAEGTQPLRIKLAAGRLSPTLIDGLKGLLTEHPGDAEVFIHLEEGQVLRLSDEFAVDPSNGLVGELRVLLGPDALV